MSDTFWRLLEQAIIKVKEEPNHKVEIIGHNDGTYELTSDGEIIKHSRDQHESSFRLMWNPEDQTFSTGRYYPELGRTVWHDADCLTETEFREEIKKQKEEEAKKAKESE